MILYLSSLFITRLTTESVAEDFPGVYRASLIASLVKNLPAMQETLLRVLGQEDPLKKG